MALQAWLRAQREKRPRPVGSFSSKIILLQRHLYKFMQLFFFLFDFKYFLSIIISLSFNQSFLKYSLKSKKKSSIYTISSFLRATFIPNCGMLVSVSKN